MERDELAAWLRLLETPGIGRVHARKLLSAFGSPQGVFDAGIDARQEIVGPPKAASLDKPPEHLDALTDATMAWLAAGNEEIPRRVIPLGDPLYPRMLLETADPPLLLYSQGRAELLAASGIAIVGSRNPTPQGVENARAFAGALSAGGITVVSGLALGIDGGAHEGALTGPGSTIAVVGTGLDRVYPKRHHDLAHRIARDGLLLSEYSLGMEPLNQNFPARNRIIAGLTRGTLVVEAAMQSGSLITARLATEAGREVFAIPGSIHSPQARGCHWLIKQGAKLVDSAQDILEELAPAEPNALPEAANDDPLLSALGYEPVSLDALVARTGTCPTEITGRLLELELDGKVARLAGQLFQRIGLG
ncbi:DNA-processing protein DprA [Piscinibacter terrae]|uniref:DNA-protecting protein DprA n=1 Tax=Piscinibacter terrae TaxID=2496871 RepID=A0A3N7K1P9_9BURK|nr:DNA-processing protein DprA [Albitalea terrae]RQP26899.1 DNA-protecting protein DprA [Albitalea terrae]